MVFCPLQGEGSLVDVDGESSIVYSISIVDTPLELHTSKEQASAVHNPPSLSSLRDAGFVTPCGFAGMWLLLARVWLCEDL